MAIYIIILLLLLLLTASFHSVAVVLTVVQIKEIITIHKRNNTKTQYILPKHPHNFQNTPTLQNKFKQPWYKIHNKWN